MHRAISACGHVAGLVCPCGCRCVWERAKKKKKKELDKHQGTIFTIISPKRGREIQREKREENMEEIREMLVKIFVEKRKKGRQRKANLCKLAHTNLNLEILEKSLHRCVHRRAKHADGGLLFDLCATIHPPSRGSAPWLRRGCFRQAILISC